MLCERASGSKNGIGVGDYGIIMIKYDSTSTITLENFCKNQNENIENALNQLYKLKDEVMNITYNSCLVIRAIKIRQIQDCESRSTLLNT